MEREYLRLLLVEDNASDAELIRRALLGRGGRPFTLECVDALAKATARLEQRKMDAVLLDLRLPDSDGAESVSRICAAAPEVPIVVLTGLDSQALALETVKRGAQDYITKNLLVPEILWGAICPAIERHRMNRELYRLSVQDELTGLFNRRGFLALAEHQIRLANRSKRRFSLLLADVDNLKPINDRFGHSEGDIALVASAAILRETFRESDALGRIGGDEFAVLVLECTEEGLTHLQHRLRSRLNQPPGPLAPRCSLSLSIGEAHYDPESPCTLDALLKRADIRLYEAKRSRLAAQALAVIR